MRKRVALEDVAWSFIGGKFSDRGAFDVSLLQHQEGLDGAETFEPNELAVLSPVISVQYMYWNGDEQIERVVTLTAENGAAFSIGDLLFQLHNAVVEQIESIDHHFFEGLVLMSLPSGGEPPLYRLRQGS